MGGRALKPYGVETERKDTKEFYAIAAKIAVQLSYGLGVTSSVPVMFEYSPSIQSTSVRCYRTKQDHGDLDVLIKVDQDFINNNINLREYIQEHFKPQAIHTNGGVISFDFENFQIDFIPISESNWKIAQVYFSYDPLGNAMGKTFHKLNLSYGWDGLKFKYRNFNGRNSHNIIISKDPRKIFEFGGYNYDHYLRGFETIEEIFDFIVAGKYFNSETFKMENLNHIDRKRNRKRKSYHAFLEYIENNNQLNSENDYIFRDKLFYSSIINGFFPEANFFEQLEKLDEKNAINKQLSEKLNGQLIMEWIPGLKGKDLGDVLKGYREYYNQNVTFEDILLAFTKENVRLHFISYYENIYGKE